MKNKYKIHTLVTDIQAPVTTANTKTLSRIYKLELVIDRRLVQL